MCPESETGHVKQSFVCRPSHVWVKHVFCHIFNIGLAYDYKQKEVKIFMRLETNVKDNFDGNMLKYGLCPFNEHLLFKHLFL